MSVRFAENAVPGEMAHRPGGVPGKLLFFMYPATEIPDGIYSIRVSLMFSSKVCPRNSAADRHRVIRVRKISK